VSVIDEEGAPRGEPGGEMERAQLARVEAESAQRRIAFLYQATGALFASPLAASRRLTVLADLMVPDLADWCFVDLFDGDAFERVAAAHWDPERHEHARQLVGRRGAVGNDRVGLGRVRRTGEAELVPLGATASRAAWIEADHLRSLGAVDVKSLVVAPLRGTEGVTGALTLVFAESARQHIAEDLALARDLAQRASLAVDNARLYESTRAAQKLQEELLAIVSHDLRNPLNAVTLAASLLQTSDKLSPDDAEQIETIVLSGRRMSRLIEDLLDVTRLEGGKRLPIQPEPIEVPSLFHETLELFKVQATARSVRLEPAIDDRVPKIWADRHRVMQVFSNLVGNSLKFTPDGGVIRFRAEPRDDAVLFLVSDTGPGIPKEHLADIFNPYWQAKRAERMGAGLGLPIAKGIVESHGGKIWVESEPDAGTTFYFTLPAARVEKKELTHSRS